MDQLRQLQKCPGRTEFENVLFIALERWEWRSPEAYCTHVKATNLERPIKMYWNLSLTCASRRALPPIQSRGRSMAENVLQHLLAKRAVVSPRYLKQTSPEYEGAQWGLADEPVSFSWQWPSLKQPAMDSPSGKDLFCVSVFGRAIHFSHKSCLRPIRCQAWDRSEGIHP